MVVNAHVAVGYVRLLMEASPNNLSAIFQSGVIEEAEVLVTANVTRVEDCMLLCMATADCKAAQLVVNDDCSTNKSYLVYV